MARCRRSARRGRTTSISCMFIAALPAARAATGVEPASLVKRCNGPLKKFYAGRAGGAKEPAPTTRGRRRNGALFSAWTLSPGETDRTTGPGKVAEGERGAGGDRVRYAVAPGPPLYRREGIHFLPLSRP